MNVLTKKKKKYILISFITEYDCNDDKWCSFGQVSINPQGRRRGGEGFWGYKFGCFTIFLILEWENTHYAYIIVVRFIFKVEIYKIL